MQFATNYNFSKLGDQSNNNIAFKISDIENNVPPHIEKAQEKIDKIFFDLSNQIGNNVV